MENKRIFGIDLGTTYSSIAFVNDYGKSTVIPSAEGEYTVPSVVFFDDDHILVGSVAKESAKLYPDQVVSFIKRSMGEPDFIYSYKNINCRAEEISSYILRKIVKDAEEHINEKITDVVITCPAYFGINEREATKRAGEIAGLTVRHVINEPTAAAIAYGASETKKEKLVLVYDLGGGTFDITLIHIASESIRVVCTGGDHNLGGKDWDDRIVSFVAQKFLEESRIEEDILEDPDTWQDLQSSAERAKKILSQRTWTPIVITHGGERVKIKFEREQFYKLTQDLLERTISLTMQMLDNSKKKGYEKFDEIVLVGGSTRMPQVAERINEEFGVEPRMFDPDEAIAKGAAIFGWKLLLNDKIINRIAEKTEKSVEDVCLEVEAVKDGAANPESGMTIGMSVVADEIEEAAREVAEETGHTLPAVKSSIVKIEDVASKSFGVVAHNKKGEEGVFNVIKRNTAVPENAKKIFYTAEADQREVLINIMECETDEEWVNADSAINIGSTELSLPPGLPAKAPVALTFSLNREGRLDISAVENTGGRSVDVTIKTTSVISEQDLAEAKARSQNLVVY